MKYTLLFLFTFATCCITACKPTCEVFYIFEVPHHIYSIHDTLSIGDTLWLESNFSDNLYDKQSGSRFVIPPDKFKVEMILNKIDTIGTNSVLPFFNLHNTNTGSIKKQGSFVINSYKFDSHIYSIKSGIVPLKKGLYTIFINSSYAEVGLPLNFEDKCDNEKGYFHFNTNNRTGNRYNLYKNSAGYNKTLTEEYYNNSGSYTFVVK
jgi:hypothetical protein